MSIKSKMCKIIHLVIEMLAMWSFFVCITKNMAATGVTAKKTVKM